MITFNEFGEDYLIEEFSGKMNASEFVSMKKSQIDQTDYFNVKGIVMDLRKAKISFSKKKLKQFFAWLIKNKGILENKSIAILTRTMDQLNFGYLLKDQITEHLIPAKVGQFSSKMEAYTWLNESRRLK